MIEIHGDFDELVRKAAETETSNELLERLSFLSNRGICKLYCYSAENADFTMFNHEGERMFNGGLVYHGFDNSWGTHT